MKYKRLTLALLIGMVACVAMVTDAFAYRGYGKGGCGAGFQGQGQGKGMQGKGAGCPIYGSSLSEEDMAKLQAERKDFIASTDALRKQIDEKEAELMALLKEEAIDADNASFVQKELSDLYGEFAQKRLGHIIRMKEINPDAAAGFGRSGRGRGGCMGNQRPRCW